MQHRTGDRYPITVLVTFDFDAESLWKQRAQGRYRGPSYLSQGTFGPKVGLGRILEVLAARNIYGTFFVPGSVAEDWPDVIASLHKNGHEIGVHGYLHEYATAMVDKAQERMVLERATEAVSRVIDSQPVGYRPPGFLYSDHTIALLREMGYLYGSAMADDDAPYVHGGNGEGLVEIPVLWHLCDDLFGWHADVRLPPSQVAEHWLSEVRELGRYAGRICVLTLHPQLIGHPGRIAMLEQVLDEALEVGGTFARCDEVARSISSRVL